MSQIRLGEVRGQCAGKVGAAAGRGEVTGAGGLAQDRAERTDQRVRPFVDRAVQIAGVTDRCHPT